MTCQVCARLRCIRAVWAMNPGDVAEVQVRGRILWRRVGANGNLAQADIVHPFGRSRDINISRIRCVRESGLHLVVGRVPGGRRRGAAAGLL